MTQGFADDTRSVLFQSHVYADYGNVRKDDIISLESALRICYSVLKADFLFGVLPV